MIQTILWDVDGTLLDFLAAEEAAIRKLFVEFDMGECSDEMLTRYSKINRSYWERLERNEITKQQVLVGRFKEFFASEGLDVGVAEQFNAKYQYALGDTIVPRDNSLEIVRKLQGKVRQYVVSNGTIIAQNKKLRLSGLEGHHRVLLARRRCRPMPRRSSCMASMWSIHLLIDCFAAGPHVQARA